MGAKQVQHSRIERRRGLVRAVAFFVLAVLVVFAAGCGEEERASDGEKAADVEIINAALARELTIASAYARGQHLLRGPYRAVGREFRAQAQEHADALTKGIRGLGGKTDAELEELDFAGVSNQADFLALAYGLENTALAGYLEAAPQLVTEAPRTLAASIGASHAQHLVVIRRGLGATPAESAPEAFEPGDLPPPGKKPISPVE